MRVVKIIAGGIVGLILGYSLWRFDYDGYSHKWEKLSAPPQEVTEIIPAGDPPFFIMTIDGNTYRYSDWQNEGWVQEPIPQDNMNWFEVTNPCDYSLPEFSQLSNAPKDIRNCIQQKTHYADGYIKYAFVKDDNGSIWRWRITRSPEDVPPMFCIPSLGLLIGIFVGFRITNGNNIKKKE